MKKMPQDQRREADVTAAVSSGSGSCALPAGCLAARDGGRAARRVRHLTAEDTTPPPQPIKKLRRG